MAKDDDKPAPDAQMKYGSEEAAAPQDKYGAPGFTGTAEEPAKAAKPAKAEEDGVVFAATEESKPAKPAAAKKKPK